MDWIFQGIGTLLVGLVIGAGGGGAIGYRVGITSTKQNQKAGNNASQTQVGRDQIRKDRR